MRISEKEGRRERRFPRLTVAGALAIGLAFAGCASAPREELVLDLRSAEVPVMLGKAPDGLALTEATFSSGHKSASRTITSTGYNGATVSSTVSFDASIAPPLSTQLLPILLLAPTAVYVRSFGITEEFSTSVYQTDESTTLSIDVGIAR